MMARSGSVRSFQATLDAATARWWFFFGFLVLQGVAVPFASRNFHLSRWADICREALSGAFVYKEWMQPTYPLFKVIPVVLIALVILGGNRYRRVFAAYVAFSYFLFAVGQNVAISETFGLCILTVNIVMFSLVGLFWIWEAVAQQNDFSKITRSPCRYWVLAPALLAFWLPAKDGGPYFDPLLLLTSGAGLGFCLMTPVYIALLSLYHPSLNVATLRVTSTVGLILGFYNMLFTWGMAFRTAWWGGVLHLPLVILSVYGLALSFSATRSGRTAPV
ncbi:hypothetical protein ACFL3S_11215 [Gemmatimonadota bacterium]